MAPEGKRGYEMKECAGGWFGGLEVVGFHEWSEESAGHRWANAAVSPGGGGFVVELVPSGIVAEGQLGEGAAEPPDSPGEAQPFARAEQSGEQGGSGLRASRRQMRPACTTAWSAGTRRRAGVRPRSSMRASKMG